MSALMDHLDKIMVSLKRREDFQPLPRASERERWQAVRAKTAQPLIARAEEYLNRSWPAITATDMLLTATGDDSAFLRKYDSRRTALAALALAEALEGNGRFTSAIINLCWLICEESAWNLPASRRGMQDAPPVVPDVEKQWLDIGAARTGELMAVTLYLHRDKLTEASPQISRRIEREIILRVIDPFVGGAGLPFGADEPEGLRACLTALLFTERDDQYRWGGIKKALRHIDIYLDALPQDGGLPGGMASFSLGVGCAMESLRLINDACGGVINFFTISVLRRVCEYIVGVHIDGDMFVSEGDNPAHQRLDAGLLYRCGELSHSEELKSLATYLLQQKPIAAPAGSDIMRTARAALDENAMLRHDARPSMPMDYYLASGQLLCVRSRSGSPEGLYAYMCGGENAPGTQADAGNIALYLDGRPVLMDLGELSYARTMSDDDRAALWEGQSQYHNLPVINDCAQGVGRGIGAEEAIWELKPERSRATLDISRAYPPEARVAAWQRTLTISRGEQPCVRLWEIAEFEGDGNSIEFNFITPYRPDLHINSLDLGDVRVSWETVEPLKVELQRLPPDQSRKYDPSGVYEGWVRAICGREIFRVALIRRNAPRKFDICFTFTRRAPN